MTSAISYAYAYVLQLVEKVPPKILMSGYQNKLNLGTTSTKNLTELTVSTNRKTNTSASTYAFVLQLVSDTMDVIQLWDPSHTENATQLSAISAFQTQIAKKFEKGQMPSAISYAYAYVLQLVEKVCKRYKRASLWCVVLATNYEPSNSTLGQLLLLGDSLLGDPCYLLHYEKAVFSRICTWLSWLD